MVEEMVVYPASRCASFGVLAVGIVGVSFPRLEVLKVENVIQTEMDIYMAYLKWWKCVVFASNDSPKRSDNTFNDINDCEWMIVHPCIHDHVLPSSCFLVVRIQLLHQARRRASGCCAPPAGTTVLVVGMRFSSEGHDFCFTPFFLFWSLFVE